MNKTRERTERVRSLAVFRRYSLENLALQAYTCFGKTSDSGKENPFHFAYTILCVCDNLVFVL